MNNKLKRMDLILVKWDSSYMTDRQGCSLTENVKFIKREIETNTIGFFIEEDDKAIVLAQSIYGLHILSGVCTDCKVIPKVFVKDIIKLDVNPLSP